MRNSKQKVTAGVGISVMVFCILWLLDFLLYPCTFIRNDIHAAVTEDFDDLYMGASFGKINIDPETIQTISGRTGHNLCVGGEYTMDTYYLIRLMIERGHAPDRIVYEVSPGYFVREKEEGNNYLLFYHEFPASLTKLRYFWSAVAKCNIRTVFFPWYEYPLSYEISHMGETVSRKWRKDYSAAGMATETQAYHESGFVERYPVDPAELTLEGLSEVWPEQILTENMMWLEKTVRLCKENGIAFNAVSTPLPESNLAAFRDGNEAVWTYFGQWFAEHDTQYINFNDPAFDGLIDHGDDNYTDLDGHMNGDAARKFSSLLAIVLN